MRRSRCLLGGLALAPLIVTMPLFIAFMFKVSTRESSSWSGDAGGSMLSRPPGECWVFNHLNKAGGSTVKYMLWPWIEKYNISSGVYDSDQWRSGPEFAREFLQKKHTIAWGAYTEGLRPYGGQECKWFTTFRHPIDRLVSAYFYCKKGAVDGLCGTAVVRAQEVDLVTFARHWGNFGLRQFLYGDVSLAAVAASKANEPPGTNGKRHAAWWEMKRYFEHLAVERSADPAAAARYSDNMTSIEYPVLKTFLAQVKDRLNDRYAAVGILEDWPTTLRLFNAAIRLPNYDWEHAPHVGKKNSNSVFRKEAEDALRSAHGDPDIHEFIRLDILLYQHALEVHAKQVREYGVGDK